MRLSHIKLAGFKSFVDPTHIPVPGQLVGVVGPNGCGKSNVIDAVRWVLGESSAKHLRGETMQDVIFNGSGERKPVNRSSVELVFDNSLGKAAGAWSKYSEISVKRVLERNGESAYFINNLHVRRKDVADIFLGTGLGGRAYAIIEQGMISRIVEAKPEELRTFLEEAAGISKYRERRRETELRLEDTRENLARVDDILQELSKQLEHLAAQAEVAGQYRTLEASLKLTQQLMWLLRKQDATNARARLTRDMEQLELELEAETARLRELEASLEKLRQAHYQSSDSVHAAQGSMYEVNAETSRLEQALTHLRDSRRRVDNQLNALNADREEAQRQDAALREAAAAQRDELADARQRLDAFRADHETLASALPEAEQAAASTRREVEEGQHKSASGEQAIQVEATREEHAGRNLAQLEQRQQRLQSEQADLQDADADGLEQLRVQLDDLVYQHQDRRDALARIEDALPDAEHGHRIAADEADAAVRELGAVDARCTALELLQKQVSRSGEMHAWLDEQQLDGLARLWQAIRIVPGWEDALEAVLRERLNAIALDDVQGASIWLTQPPPGKVCFFQKRDGAAFASELAGRKPLLSFITCVDPAVALVLSDWLDRVYVVDDAAAGFAQRESLPAGAVLVCPQGHVFTRDSVSYHAADSEVHGILSRQREIEELRAQHTQLEARADALREQANLAQAALHDQREQAMHLREHADDIQRQRHDVQLDHVRLSEQAERAQHRRGQIAQDLAEIEAELEDQTNQRRSASQRLEALRAELVELRNSWEAARERNRLAVSTLDSKREAVQGALRRLQEADFDVRVIQQKIDDIETNLALAVEKQQKVAGAHAELSGELASLDEAPVQAQLNSALETRVEREKALADARENMEQAELALKDSEQQRMSCEQRLNPLRERVGEVRLKEQEARLAEENFAAQLAEAGADEEALAAQVQKGMRPNALQADSNRLSAEIEALGAVNLAALQELETNQERKNYLDAQSQDLREAVQTLESAIRRIDRETRERLQVTFDQVNENLAQMFPALFGGGEARLLMTGEEILDAGLQILARPPGKKNASIHLLSGGEKALTALALVFSLFQLNPAPFCLLDEVDAPLDDSNTERFCNLVRKMSQNTQFLFISHNKITMELATQLIGITMPEQGVSKVVAVDIEEALRLREEAA
ncbi:MAG: chromosome segregation protein SMC [Betaproteobacteria bacterium]